jgi:predicted DNA-binding transcriptional regulator AlpA
VKVMSNMEAANYLRRSQSFLNKLRCSGGGPSFVRIGRRIGYLQQDLDEWLLARRRRSTSDSGLDEDGRERQMPRWNGAATNR